MTAAPPETLPVNLDGIPEKLRVLPAWIGWRWAFRDGRWTKEPIDLKTGALAATNDPKTWVDFDTAARNYGEIGCDGIGLCRTGDLIFIDVDGVLKSKNGHFAWAERFIPVLDGKCYWERSITGTGLHGIASGKLPPGRRQFDEPGREHVGFAFYDGSRFFTMSGHALESSGSIEDVTAELTILHSELFPASSNGSAAAKHTTTPSSLSDSDLIDRARRAKNGHLFSRLWAGDISEYPSQSEAEQALCCHLAFYTGRDPGRMGALFRQSGLYREKWERQDYREMTIAKACEMTTETYTPPRPREPEPPPPSDQDAPPPPEESSQREEPPPKGKSRAKNRSAAPPLQASNALSIYRADYPAAVYVIDDILPQGLTLAGGRPKVGKSWLALKLAVAVAFGEKALGRFKVELPGRVTYLALEESERRTSRRLRKIVLNEDARIQNIQFIYKALPLMTGGAIQLDEFLAANPSELVVIDTLLAFVSAHDARKDILRGDYNEAKILQELAEKHKCAILCIVHTRKAPGDAVDSITGTSGVTAGCDSVWNLKRVNTGDAVLEVRGRDLEDGEALYGLTFKKGDPSKGESFSWIVTGEGSDVGLSEERRDILTLLHQEGAMKPAAVARALVKNAVTVRRLIQNLAYAGLIQKQKDGTYVISVNAVNAMNDSNK